MKHKVIEADKKSTLNKKLYSVKLWKLTAPTCCVVRRSDLQRMKVIKESREKAVEGGSTAD